MFAFCLDAAMNAAGSQKELDRAVFSIAQMAIDVTIARLCRFRTLGGIPSPKNPRNWETIVQSIVMFLPFCVLTVFSSRSHYFSWVLDVHYETELAAVNRGATQKP